MRVLMITNSEWKNYRMSDGLLRVLFAMEREDYSEDSEIFPLRCVNFIKWLSFGGILPRNRRYKQTKIWKYSENSLQELIKKLSSMHWICTERPTKTFWEKRVYDQMERVAILTRRLVLHTFLWDETCNICLFGIIVSENLQYRILPIDWNDTFLIWNPKYGYIDD